MHFTRGRMRWLGLTTLFALGVFAAACSEEPQPDPTPPAPPPRVVTPDVESRSVNPTDLAAIEFSRCSFETDGGDGRAECAEAEVPLDWANPAGRRIKIFVKRLLGSAQGAHRQLWLLQGGPGAAGDTLEPMADEASRRNPSFDIYIPDHRGTGRSARMDCPLASSNLAGFDYRRCASEVTREWGSSGLASFTTTAAARDLGHIIERVRGDQAIYIYGISYGTYLAQRYLQLFPDRAAAVSLDSVCQAGLCSVSKIGYWFDRIGKKYLAECAADATCAARLGPDPAAKVREAYAKADAGTCPGFRHPGDTLRELFGMFIASLELRPLVLATTFRILRCNDEDVAALKRFESALQQQLAGGASFGPTELRSAVLGINIMFSEMEESPLTPSAELEKLLEGALFARYDATQRQAYDSWPKYARDEWVGRYPDTAVPMLLMNGTLDPQTPLEFAEQIAPHYAKPGQGLVVFPRAPHGVLFNSPQSAAPDAPSCGSMVWDQFLVDPSQRLDTSCTARILPHDFEGARVATFFFGTTTLWGPPAPIDSIVKGPQRGAGVSTSETTAASSRAIRRELVRAAASSRPWLPTSHVLVGAERALSERVLSTSSH